MLTLKVRLKNLAFVIIGALAIGYIGYYYANLGRYVGIQNYYVVKVDLAVGGGLLTNAEVTYRGVGVGRVGPMKLTEDGLQAHLHIKNNAPKIPQDVKAVVASRSAVGEQYLDLRPNSMAGPFLAEGYVVPRAVTTTPAPVTDLLKSFNDVATSVDLNDLRTVTDEWGIAFSGLGPHLQRLLDNSAAFVETANANVDVTNRLIYNSELVLRTQNQEASAFRSFARDAKSLSAQLRTSNTDLKRLIAAAPVAAEQFAGLLRDVDPNLSVLVANLLTTSDLLLTRHNGLEQLLVNVPAAVSAGTTVVSGDKLNLGHGDDVLQSSALHQGLRRHDLPERFGHLCRPAAERWRPVHDAAVRRRPSQGTGERSEGRSAASCGQARLRPEDGLSGSARPAITSRIVVGHVGAARIGGPMIGRILPAAAICFLGFAGWTVWDARGGEKAESLSPARDLVLRQGSEQIAVLNTMDYAKVDDGLRAWLNAATGPLHDQLRKDAPANRQKILTVRTKAAGAVVDAAVTAVDLRAGNARLIASVRIDLTGHDGAPSTQRKRYEAGLTRTPDGWKLTSLIMIPINGR